jgi:SAM-dependent methyltransferase
LSINRDIGNIYRNRFSEADSIEKNRIWRELAHYLQRYVPDDAPVLDLACGHGGFIRNITASERWACDIRASSELSSDIQFVQTGGLRLGGLLPKDHFGCVFVSNYLEHLDSSDAVIEQLRIVHALLRSNGTLLVLQPNIRLVGHAYWDFIDHKTPLTEKSLEEAAVLAGFETEKLITRFIPYTTNSRTPQRPTFVRLYLQFKPIWRLMGKQKRQDGRQATSR